MKSKTSACVVLLLLLCWKVNYNFIKRFSLAFAPRVSFIKHSQADATANYMSTRKKKGKIAVFVILIKTSFSLVKPEINCHLLQYSYYREFISCWLCVLFSFLRNYSTEFVFLLFAVFAAWLRVGLFLGNCFAFRRHFGEWNMVLS